MSKIEKIRVKIDTGDWRNIYRIGNFIEHLNKIQSDAISQGLEDISIDFRYETSYYDSVDIIFEVQGWRDETPEEQKARLRKDRQDKSTQLVYKRLEYERLKAIFEKDSKND
jgi:hypothetical protein